MKDTDPIKYRHNPRLEWINAISFLLLLAMGTFMKIMTDGINAAIVIVYLLAAFCLVNVVNMRRNGYLKIENDWMTRYSIIRKNIKLSEVWDVRKNVYGHYVLFTDYGKLEIRPGSLGKKAFKALKEELKKYNLELE